MKKRRLVHDRCCVWAVLASACASHAEPPTISDEVLAIWNDPGFQKAFVGSYGINADIEPRVTPEEVEILEKIRPLMGSVETLPKAESTLKKNLKPESSAMLDFTLANIQFQQGKLADALANYQVAVSTTKFPSFRRAHRNIGLIHVREGRYEESIKAFTKMIELGGGDGYSYGLLGFAYASKQDGLPGSRGCVPQRAAVATRQQRVAAGPDALCVQAAEVSGCRDAARFAHRAPSR
jgi:tetratricopeptide (TPR) repeat protein